MFFFDILILFIQGFECSSVE